jgi:hypothetical protein
MLHREIAMSTFEVAFIALSTGMQDFALVGSHLGMLYLLSLYQSSTPYSPRKPLAEVYHF